MEGLILCRDVDTWSFSALYPLSCPLQELESSVPCGISDFSEILVDCDEDSVLINGKFPNFPPIERINQDGICSLFAKLGKELLPVVALDESGVVLMQAFANQEALGMTLRDQYAYYYSRSRSRLWKKGEESGNLQKLVMASIISKLPLLIYTVIPVSASCHTGYYSCYYRRLSGGKFMDVYDARIFDPDQVYGLKK